MSKDPDHAILDARINRIIEILATNTEVMAQWIDRMKILNARVRDLEAKLENSKHTNDQYTNDLDAESRRLARELLAEARAFGKPN